MGLAQTLGWNAVSDFIDPRRNMLVGLGAGLASGQNFGQGVSNGLQMAAQGKTADDAFATSQKAEAARQQQMNQTIEWLRNNQPDLAGMVQAGMPVAEAWNTAMQRMQPKSDVPSDLSSTAQGREQLAKQFGLQGPDSQMYVLTGKLPGSNQSVRAGVGQPIYGQNKTTGAIEPWQSMSDGTMVNTANPQAKPTDYNFDPGVASGARATGTVDANTAGAARAALPAAEQAAVIANKAIDLVSNDQKGLNEQFGTIMGVPQRNIPVLPGSSLGNWQANFQQAKGQAFLQARQMLKGGGQITDYEGAKAEAAFSRMSAAADTGDKGTFQAAAEDFRAAINAGLEKLRAVAQGGYSQGGAQMPGGGGGWEVVGVE